MDTPYRAIVEHLREAVVILQHCHLHYANPAAASLLALAEPDFTSASFLDFLPIPEQKNQLKQVCAQTEASQLAPEAVLALEIVDAQGKVKMLQVRAAPLLWRDAPATMCFLAEAPVSGQVVAVENATLYEQAQAEINERKQAQALANRYLEQQIIVNQLALTLGQLTQLEEIYQAIYVQISSLLPVDLFIISFFDSETNLIRAGYVIAYGQKLDAQKLPEIPLAEQGKGMQSQVIRSGLPLCVAEFKDGQKNHHVIHLINRDGSLKENGKPQEDKEIIQSQLYVPMNIGGECVGVMQIQSEKNAAYTQSDVDLLTSLANMAAIALQNARLLAQSREHGLQVEQIVSSVPDGVLLLDAELRLVMVNPAAKCYLPLLAPTEIGEVLTHLGERPLAELLLSPPNGFWHEVDVGDHYFDMVAQRIKIGPAHDGWVVVLHDMTREREIQTRLLQQDRLAAVGQLAAGIAHDFNNIMTVISLYTDLIERAESNLLPTTQQRLTVIAQQSNRAADLIEQILDFSRRSVLERCPLDFLPFLKEVIKLLDRTLIENIHIQLLHDPGRYGINADPTRMQQMLMNLAVNARDAMPHGGALTFDLRLLSVKTPQRDAPDLMPGNWLRLQVIDEGIGIAPEVLPHVFDPFYTTKAPGSGSGLGLAQVWGIVKQHQGQISVSTAVSRGTTFTIHLPLLGQEEGFTAAETFQKVVDGSRETVLIVEDNDVTRQVMVESLSLLNYRTLTAVNGLEALAVIREKGNEIALILSDVVMPEMGGVALLRTLRQQGWQTAVLLLTGNPLNKDLEEALSYPNVEWLSKPITLEQLAEAVSRRLGKHVSPETL